MRRQPAQHEALGRAIRTRRRELAVSQEELAHRAGVHRTYLGGLERGERNPSIASLLKVAEALGIRVSTLVAEAEELMTDQTPASV